MSREQMLAALKEAETEMQAGRQETALYFLLNIVRALIPLDPQKVR